MSSQVWYSGVNEGKIEYGYDIEGRLISKKYPEDSNLETVTFSYDRFGKVTSVSKGNTKVRDYVYDQAGKITETREYFNNLSYVSTLYGYDSFNRAVSVFYKDGENILESFEYVYDKNDNITQMQHVNSILPQEKKFSETRSYSYDNLGNLTESSSERLSGGNTVTSVSEYVYDDAGNRISETVDGNETSYTYNGLNQLVSSTSGNLNTEYEYDQRGNQILKSDSDGNRTEQTFAVTGEMLTLTESTADVDDAKTVTLTQENKYSTDGQRIQKCENSNTTQYFYDEGAAAYSKTGNKVTANLLSPAGSVIGNIENDEYCLFFKDMQGSTSSIVGPSGDLKAAYRYSDFGKTQELTGNPCSNEICYTGAVYDESTGLYYMNARYYSPEDGRFISQDSYRGEKDDPGQWHLYTYCANNPINYVDPSGHFIVRRWMVATPIDLVASACGLGLVFTPIKTLCKSYGKALSMVKFKSRIFKFTSKLKNCGYKIGDGVYKILRKIPLIKKVVKSKRKAIISKVESTLYTFVSTQVVNKFANIMFNNITLCLSLGGMVSSALDYVYDRKFNNVVYKI